MNKFKKTLSLLLVAVLVLSVVPAAATDGLSNSTPSVDYEDWISTNPDSIGDHNVEVMVTKGSNYMITIPKTVVLAGSTGIGSYAVKVEGDLSGTEYITVEPYTTNGLNLLENNNTFDLTQTGKDAVPAKVTQTKIEWNIADMIDASGTIAATDDDGNNLLTAGSWSGSFVFNINRNERQTTLEGDGQTYHKMAPSTLSFRSNAPIDEFQQVLINGEPLDEGAYTLTEGSTIVTLNIDYLETLDVDNYEITVVSKNGSPSADFGVVTTGLNEHGFYYNQPYAAYVETLGYNVAFFIRAGGTFDIIAYGDASGVENGTYTMNGNNILVNTSMGLMNATISNDGKEIYVHDLATTFSLDLANGIVADDNYVYIYTSGLGGVDTYDGFEVAAFNKTKTSYPAFKSNINGISVTQISSYAFDNCNELISFVIPDGILYLSNDAFGNCEKLNEIHIPKTVKTINTWAFNGCHNLSKITYNGTIADWNALDVYLHNVSTIEVICSDGIVSLN